MSDPLHSLPHTTKPQSYTNKVHLLVSIMPPEIPEEIPVCGYEPPWKKVDLKI